MVIMDEIIDKSILTEQDFYEYLLNLYFNLKNGYLEASINRAYLDFSRTLHGIRKHPKKEMLFKLAKNKVIETITEMKDIQFENQRSFDNFHKKLSLEIRKIYRDNNFDGFNIGHSQKWINMTLKYIFTMKEKRIPGYKHVYQYSHVPLDNIIISKLKEYGFKGLNNRTWSRIDDYQEYFEIQQWIRKRFPKFLPMDVEFKLWIGEILDKFLS